MKSYTGLEPDDIVADSHDNRALAMATAIALVLLVTLCAILLFKHGHAVEKTVDQNPQTVHALFHI